MILLVSDKPFVKAAAAVIVLKGGKVLLGKRVNTKLEGYWCFPGGKMEFGESAENAARRELKEEAGIDSIDLKFVGFADIPYDEHWVTMLFLCENFSGNPSVQEGEKFSEWQWFSRDALPSPLMGHTKYAFEKLLVSHGF